LAAGAGLDRDVAAVALTSEVGLEAIRAAEGEGRRLGVQGVPFFIVNGELTLSGAQEPGAFLAAFERVTDAGQVAGEGGTCAAEPGREPSC
jgi:predicted DsbA family dithiol-disulfide isomerase